MSNSPTTGAPGSTGAPTPGIKTAITVAVLGIMMAQFPTNLVSVSLTTIVADTGASTAGLQWIQSIYILAMSAAVLSAGVITENIGRRKVKSSTPPSI